MKTRKFFQIFQVFSNSLKIGKFLHPSDGRQGCGGGRRTTSALQAHYKRTTSALQAHYKRTTSALQAHYKCTTSALQAHYKRTTSALQAHYKRTTSALQVHYKRTTSALQILPIIALLASFSSCRTIRVIEQVPVPVHDTLRLTQMLRDSIYIDHFREITKMHDTIYITERQIVSKWRTVTDTAYKYVEKPVTVTVEQIKEVEKPLSWWQQRQIRGFWVLLTLLVMAATIFVIRLKIHP